MRFFTSDHHFGHANIINFCDRPFTDVAHMNNKMVSLWNEVVSEDDTVYHLGDFAMGDRFNCVPFAGALNGVKVLVPGNHDTCWSGGRKGPRNVDLYDRYFNVIQGPHHLVLANGLPVVLNHFPGRGVNDQYDRKFSPWEYDGDLWLLHGHTHALERVKRDKQLIHVGVDAWGFRPVSEDAVIALIEEAS